MTQFRPTRRDAIVAAAAFAGSLALDAKAGAASLGRADYGSCVRPLELTRDRDYAAALIRYCRLLIPEGSMNWSVTRPSPEQFDFADADRIAAFASRNGMALRGHNLVWHGDLAPWVERIDHATEAERAMTAHIEALVSRYRGVTGSWIVVNEPTPEHPVGRAELRDSVWSRTMGPGYIAKAFRAAAAADPGARLILNEYDIEFVGERFAMRRDILLGIARDLVEKGVPIHAIGLQGHLLAEREIDRDGLQAFLRKVRALGLEVLVTELDVIDKALPGDVATRDARVAASARAFLEAVAEVSPPSSIVTWGISDRYTWVPMFHTRDDGLPVRPLPLDAAYRPKPLMAVIERYTRYAS